MANTSVGNLSLSISSSVTKSVNSINKLTASLQVANTELAKMNTLTTNSPVTLNIGKINNSVKKLETQSKQTTKAVQTMSGSLGSLKDTLMFSIGFGSLQQGIRTVTNLFTQGFTQASEFVENYNLFNVSMRGSTEEAMKYQNLLNNSMKVNMSESMRYQGFFKNLANSLGITNDASTLLSENLTNLTYDLSSLYNVDFQTMYSKLQSGIVGQTKPLRSVGIDVTQQTLQPLLYEMGINKYVTELTQAEKVLLRYISIIKQSESAHGDFARTIETPSNQIRIFNDQIKELQRWFGTMFIGTIGKILPYVNAFVITLKEVFKWVSLAFGFNVEDYDFLAQQDERATELEEDLNGALNSSEKLRKSLAGFDEINNIAQESSGSNMPNIGLSDTYTALLAQLEGYDNGMDKIKTKAGEISDKLLSWLGFTKQINEETNEITYFFTGISEISLDRLASSFEKLSKPLVRFGNAVLDNLILFYEEFMLPISKIAIEETIPSFLDLLAQAIDTSAIMWEESKNTLKDFYKEFLLPLGKVVLDTVTTMIKNLTTALNDLGQFAKDNPEISDFLERLTLILIGMKAISGLALILAGVNTPLLLMGVAIGAFVYFYDDIKNMWEALSPSDQMLVSLGLLAGGIWAVTLAIMGMQSAWTLGLGAVAIVAGITAMTIAVENMKKGITTNTPTIPTTQMPTYTTPTPTYNPYGTPTYNPNPTPQKTTYTPTLSNKANTNKYIPNIGMYADGGFPTSGQMFIAREGGAEMVGSIGGRTSVANNDQIVEAVSQGVAQAVSSVMNSNGQTTVNLILNDDVFGRAVIKSANKTMKNTNLVLEV